jgi:hypothetical protein
VASEILTAATASGGIISGWALWKLVVGGFQIGVWSWSILGGVAAISAVVKPFLRWDLTIKSYTELQQQYRAIGASLDSLIFSIRMAEKVTDDHMTRYQKLRERADEASTKFPPKTDDKLLSSCQDRVLGEKPADTLWTPPVVRLAGP